MLQAMKAYRDTQVATTSPGQVLVMLYDGALAYITQAKELMAAKDYAGKGIKISKALDVINELASSLNPEKGGDLAANLAQLYFYCNKRLFMANLKMDVTILDEVAGILAGLRNAYVQILDSPEALAASAQVEMTRKVAPQNVPIVQTESVSIMPAATQQTRMRGAYAQQTITKQGTATPAPPAAPKLEALPEKVEQKAEEKEPPMVMPLLDTENFAPLPESVEAMASAPLGMIGANKRLAASSLYRKFSS